MPKEPTLIEMFLTKLAFLLYGRAIYKEFADRLPLTGNEQVLDFGCGRGNVAYFALKRLPQGNLTCLDVSNRWLQACRQTLRKYRNITFLHADASALPEEEFDVIYCHFVLHEIPGSSIETGIASLVKALKTGGFLIFKEPLNELEKLKNIKQLLVSSGLTLQSSRITDLPRIGNALESIYTKLITRGD